MQFDKDVLFLGKVLNTISGGSGGQYFAVELYDQGSGSVKVNVMDNPDNRDIIKALDAAAFGTPLAVTFTLKPHKNGGLRLVIDHVN